MLYLLELGVGPIGDPLGDVVDVGAGGAGETVAATSTLHSAHRRGRGAEAEND